MKLSRLIRRDPDAPSLRERAAGLKSSLLRLTARPALPPALPAPGSDEAVAAWQAARSAFDRLTPLSDAEYAALRIGDSFTLWTTERVRDVQRGDFMRFTPREMESARSKSAAELSDLLVLTTRRDLRFAEAERRTNLRTLYALAYPNGEDPADEPDPSGDHAHVVVAEHRAAYEAWKPLGDAWNEMPGGPGWDEAREAQDEPNRVTVEAFGELIDTVATTPAGLRALAAYLPGAVHDANCVEVEEDARRALRSVCRGVLALVEDAEADDELVRLESEFLATETAFCAAADAMSSGHDRYTKPPVPLALKVWSNDWIYTSIPRPRIDWLPDGSGRHRPYGEFEVEILRTQPCLATFVGGEGELQPDGIGRVRLDPHAQARADAIVAAWDEWQAQIREARAAVDLETLEAAYDATQAARDAVLQQVREATARGLAGLAVKARIAASMAMSNDLKATGLKTYDADDPDGLLHDIAGDVLSLTGGLPEAFRLQD